MTADDLKWEPLAAQWQATPMTTIAADALRSGLRWRQVGSWLYLGIEIGAVALMAVVVGLQWTTGARGAAVAVAALTALSVAASLWARAAAARGSRADVVGLLDLSIARATRSLRLTLASYVVTAGSVVYVAVMYFSTVGPPGSYGDDERALVALGLLAAYTAGTLVYHWYAHRRWQRLTRLRDLLMGPDTSSDVSTGGPR